MKYRDFFRNQINSLITCLESAGIKENIINDMVNSGYICCNNVICDTFYGLNQMYIPPVFIDQIKYYQENKKWGHCFPAQNKIYTVNDINEINDILKRLEEKYTNLLYRGVTNMYTFKRAFPSPYFSDGDGNEISMIPSFYRKFSKDYMEREEQYIKSTGNSPLLEPVYFQEFRKLVAAYENHELSFMDFWNKAEDFREGYWSNCISVIDTYTIEQHYGMESIVLDVTYNIKVALFFAFYKLVNIRENYYDYVKIGKDEYKNSVVYVLKPQTDLPDLESWKYTDIAVGGYKCTRPIRQECTSLTAGMDSINRAASEIVAIIKFSDHFILPEDIPKKEYLFPSAEEDPFWDAVIKNEPDDKVIMRYIFNE